MHILVDAPTQSSGLEVLRNLPGVSVDCIEAISEYSRWLEPERLRPANILLCSDPPVNHAALESLQWIHVASSGYSQLYGLGLPARGIRATNSRGCTDIPIAEWNISMMINLARNLPQMFRNQQAAHWERTAEYQREIRGLTVGLWGYGGLGRETARLARQLGMRVHVLTRHGVGPREECYVVPGTGDPTGALPHRVFAAGEEIEFLSSLDFLVVAMPLTPVSEGLIGERELRALRPSAFLLNPARGPIVQESALLRALRENWISGAALDTHYAYPLPADHPLWKMPNVILTPHVSGAGLGSHFSERLWDLFLQNVRRFMRHEPLLNELTAAQLNGK